MVVRVPGIVGHHLGDAGVGSHEAVDVGGFMKLVC